MATSRNLTWTDNDLVKTASQGTMSSTFLYDGFGNLVRTSARQTGGGTVASTYYVSGGAEIYELGDGGSPVIREWTIAGGVSRDVATAVINGNGPYYRHLGHRRYELTDHLGSVRGIISDTKLPDGGTTFKSELYNVAEYDAYGMERPFRSREIVAAGFYRYGFQGMRRADGLTATISASRNEYVTPFRLYDAKMGTWMSHDPIMHAGVSPYEGLGSNPISMIDPLGLDDAPAGGSSGTSGNTGGGAGGNDGGGTGGSGTTGNSPTMSMPESGAVGMIAPPPLIPTFVPKNYFEMGLPYPNNDMMMQNSMTVKSTTFTADFTVEDIMQAPYYTLFYLGNQRVYTARMNRNDDEGFAGKLGLAVYDPVAEQWDALFPIYKNRDEEHLAQVMQRIEATKNLDAIALGVILSPIAIIGGWELAPLALGGGALEGANLSLNPEARKQAADVVDDGLITLYRAVRPEELESIRALQGKFTIPLGENERKFFTTGVEFASQYARMAVRAFRDEPYTIISTRVPVSLLQDPLNRSVVDRGIPSFLLGPQALQGLEATILQYSIYPWGLP